jgi:hypothetical protein
MNPSVILAATFASITLLANGTTLTAPQPYTVRGNSAMGSFFSSLKTT